MHKCQISDNTNFNFDKKKCQYSTTHDNNYNYYFYPKCQCSITHNLSLHFQCHAYKMIKYEDFLLLKAL